MEREIKNQLEEKEQEAIQLFEIIENFLFEIIYTTKIGKIQTRKRNIEVYTNENDVPKELEQLLRQIAEEQDYYEIKKKAKDALIEITKEKINILKKNDQVIWD